MFCGAVSAAAHSVLLCLLSVLPCCLTFSHTDTVAVSLISVCEAAAASVIPADPPKHPRKDLIRPHL